MFAKVFQLGAFASILLAGLFTVACGAPEIDDEQAQVADQQAQARRAQAEGKMCGGFANLQCKTGLTCVYETHTPDASGVCVNVARAPRCGGFAALPCTASLVCVPEPGSLCNTASGGRDCSGICIPHL